MTGAELQERQDAGVPDLVYGAGSEITAADVSLPRMKIGQSMTPHVQEGRVEFGSIFTELSKDDPEPNQIADPPEKGQEPVPFHVIGLVKGKSLSSDGELDTWAFDDPAAPSEAWTTYKYTVVIPTVDEDIPYSLLLTRTSTPAAKQLNLMIQKAAAFGPPSEVEFEFASKRTQNKKGTYYIAQVSQAQEPGNAKERKAREARVEVVRRLADLVRPQAAAEPSRSTDEPEL